MAPFARVLAATDLSMPARAAVERAARLAAASGAELHLVHVAEPAPVEQLQRALGLPASDIPERLVTYSGTALAELAESLQAAHGVRATIHQRSGMLLEEVEGVAQAVDADLLLLGARGHSVARHLLLGSTAERLVGRIERSILVVRLPSEVNYRRVIVTVDFSPGSLRALQRAQALAPCAELLPLHAYEAPFEAKLSRAGVDKKHLKQYVRAAEQDARRRMSELLESAGVPRLAEPMVLHGHPVAHTLDQEEEFGCQLLVVGKTSRSRLQDVLLGSISRRVLMQARGDVLVSA